MTQIEIVAAVNSAVTCDRSKAETTELHVGRIGKFIFSETAV